MLLSIFLTGNYSQAQELTDNSQLFYFDAIVFKSALDTNGRLDVYVIVPYQSLAFEKFEEFYGSNYELTVKITNDKGNRIDQKKTQE